MKIPRQQYTAECKESTVEESGADIVATSCPSASCNLPTRWPERGWMSL
ncbi:MAG: hypothetical protein OEZ04_00585 [Nitrospinota bacterium]|nr:hypothetical protein [Nitrospinota bacterium]